MREEQFRHKEWVKQTIQNDKKLVRQRNGTEQERDWFSCSKIQLCPVQEKIKLSL